MRKVLAAALAAASVAAVAVAVAWADGSPAVIHACVADRSGIVRIRAASDACSRHQTALDWNQQGPQGAQGPTGPVGPAGPAGAAGSAASTEPNARVVGFLQVAGPQGKIVGDSTDAQHPRWITVLGFDSDSSVATVTGGSTGGAQAGKVDSKPLVITKAVDGTTPQLYQALVTGERLDVQLDLVRAGASGNEVYYSVKLTNATVSEIHQSDAGMGDGSALEQVSFVYQKIQISAPGAGGSTPSTTSWDLTTQTAG